MKMGETLSKLNVAGCKFICGRKAFSQMKVEKEKAELFDLRKKATAMKLII